jgi:single-stranded-DNA-specific exonuclease
MAAGTSLIRPLIWESTNIRIILAMRIYSESISDSLDQLKAFLEELGDNVVLLSHGDADGLCSAALLKRFLRAHEHPVRHLYPAKGETAFGPATMSAVAALEPSSLFVLDLGVSESEIASGIPTVFIDHHRPLGTPGEALVLTSYGEDPAPPTSHITYDLLSRLEPLEHLAWIWAVGAGADLGSDFVLDHGAEAVKRLKKADITDAEVLLNSGKRSSRYDIDTPIGLLEDASGLSDLVDREDARVRALDGYRDEVNREVRRCRQEKPHFSWKAAVIPFESPCEIQGLIAETWRRQLENYLVLAVNFGYIEGKVAYAARTELDASVIDFMESLKPAGYTAPVVWGHDRAAGGVVDADLWHHLAGRMGFKNKG